MADWGRLFHQPVKSTWEQIVERDPIIAFSFYLCGRVHVLLAVADEIIENLDQAFRDKVVDGGRVERAESLMWLWTLGAYEVVRTMCQAKSCFSDRTMDQLTHLKKTLSAVSYACCQNGKGWGEGFGNL
jgi:hypothetical protein